MRGSVAKMLRREAAKGFPDGSRMGRGTGMSVRWLGTRKKYRELKKEHNKG